MHKRKIFSLVRKLPRNETTKSCGKGKNRESLFINVRKVLTLPKEVISSTHLTEAFQLLF